MQVSHNLIPTGQFCTVTFVKLDGTVRTLNGRTGVNKYLKGTGNRSDQTRSNYFLLWVREGSNKFNTAKNINKKQIISIKAHGIKAEKNLNSNYAKAV
jgi:hypothetical protein